MIEERIQKRRMTPAKRVNAIAKGQSYDLELTKNDFEEFIKWFPDHQPSNGVQMGSIVCDTGIATAYLKKHKSGKWHIWRCELKTEKQKTKKNTFRKKPINLGYYKNIV